MRQVLNYFVAAVKLTVQIPTLLLTSIRNLNQHSQRCTADMRTAIRMTAAMLMARIVGCVHTMSPIISMTLKYKLLTFKRNVNFAIILGGELNSYGNLRGRCLTWDQVPRPDQPRCENRWPKLRVERRCPSRGPAGVARSIASAV